ncbi:hypothetical protein HELRODRAFT_180520 [Helobdella robusta]|uniref:Armadillo repeat-containing domain-containing protein n=1 Tax=Helobdella robusta TaxID=6412 RepID=T1FG02_HELRO|nr:hypothetical protein HELRODRAFT_180520 [Helobdella robusta]ESN93868.1 hypothetical protein HELRODRAFT_180520 [Helobdella robusta]
MHQYAISYKKILIASVVGVSCFVLYRRFFRRKSKTPTKPSSKESNASEMKNVNSKKNPAKKNFNIINKYVAVQYLHHLREVYDRPDSKQLMMLLNTIAELAAFTENQPTIPTVLRYLELDVLANHPTKVSLWFLINMSLVDDYHQLFLSKICTIFSHVWLKNKINCQLEALKLLINLVNNEDVVVEFVSTPVPDDYVADPLNNRYFEDRDVLLRWLILLNIFMNYVVKDKSVLGPAPEPKPLTLPSCKLPSSTVSNPSICHTFGNIYFDESFRLRLLDSLCLCHKKLSKANDEEMYQLNLQLMFMVQELTSILK